ncbi:hypothetical protein BS78_08G043400 [Paspalum vaginatum]|nr:hypothetical protein BS78_08G043400 [Paspalum vaginatum]
MATPWVILGRVLRGVPGPEDAGAEADELHAPPDFTFPVALPPRVNIVAAGRDAHPEPNSPDAYPYIIAANPLGLLVHFAAAPFYGTQFCDNHHASHLVLVRNFHTAEGQATATAERVTGRADGVPGLQNIGNVAFACSDHGDYLIAELQVRDGDADAVIVYHLSSDGNGWAPVYVAYPLAAEDRQWIPHGGAYLDGTFWWFDLSWGILSFDAVAELEAEQPGLLFHDLPDDRALQEAAPNIHTRRCVAVSRDRLRYVDIFPEGEAAMVTMWTRVLGDHGWEWNMDYAVSFESIWNDDSYTETRLPRDVPVLAVVSPSNHEVVYFALEQHLFGVNVPEHRVVHFEAYELENMPGPPPPASGRFLVAWDLSPVVAQALGMNHPFANFDAGELAAEHDTESEEQDALESEDEEQPVVDPECKEQLANVFSYIEEQQAGESEGEEQPVADTYCNCKEQLAEEIGCAKAQESDVDEGMQPADRWNQTQQASHGEGSGNSY